MRKIWLVALILGLGAAAVMALMLMRDRPSWTSRRPDARAAFESCLEGRQKWYFAEARAACERALELDPDFVIARLTLAGMTRELQERQALLEQVRAADLSPLSPRERFLVNYRLTLEDGRLEDAREIVAAFLAEHPRDPYALSADCALAWDRRDYATAESCNERLLEIDPNWVEAQNHLGYILMAQGRFQEAEDRFLAYRFVAPDQANPYDSMAELLTLTGRYEEAEAALEQALRIRPDFCSSHLHLVQLYLLWHRFDAAEAALARIESADSGCDEASIATARCSELAWREASAGLWETTWRALQEAECLAEPSDAMVIGHEAAARSGRLGEAAAIEERLKSYAEAEGEKGAEGETGEEVLAALLLEMKANRLAAAGRPADAAAAYRLADEKLRFWVHSGLGIFKLYTKLGLATALSQQGKEAEAQEVVDQIRAVNPRFAELFRPAGEAGEAAAP